MADENQQGRTINRTGCFKMEHTPMKDMNEKNAYLQKLSEQLMHKEAELDKLKARVSAAKEDIRVELLKEIEDLHAKKEAAKGKIKQLQEAGDDMWDDVKAGAENSWSELRAAFSKVYSTLKSREHTAKP
jgi:predicted  nucleic acid-binding Zn-ribbon protein